MQIIDMEKATLGQKPQCLFASVIKSILWLCMEVSVSFSPFFYIVQQTHHMENSLLNKSNNKL